MLTPEWKQLRYHPDHARLWRDPARFVAVCAGRGSGKTELSRRRVVRYLCVKKPWPDPLYAYALPTQDQARRVAWVKIKELVPERWIVTCNESTMTLVTAFGSTLNVIGLDRPHRAEGVQYDGVVIDESSDQRPGVFDLTFRPALSHRNGWCWRIGVPKRRGIGAKEFRETWDKWAKLREAGLYNAYEWRSDTVMTPEEIAIHRDSMDPKDFAEQFCASWEQLGGLVYYCFDEVVSVRDSISYDREKPIIVGSDFNVDPMAWVLMQQHGEELHVFDEVWIRNTNTVETLDALHSRYGDHAAGWHFFGDANWAMARKTSAQRTDYVIIKNDVRFKKSKMHYASSNPAVLDRHAAVNAQLKSASGKRKLFIHPRCRYLIKDLGYLSYKKGSREVDERDPDAGHITDALGYPIHRLRPVLVESDQQAGRTEVVIVT